MSAASLLLLSLHLLLHSRPVVESVVESILSPTQSNIFVLDRAAHILLYYGSDWSRRELNLHSINILVVTVGMQGGT